MNKTNLYKERKKIDKVDQQIFKLIKKRTIIVKKMLSLKKYNPATRKHELFVEKKLPPHSK